MSEERREDIMAAVAAALCDRGYARVTVQDIADESALSKAAILYHYDTKRDLLVAFLEHLHARFTDRLVAAEAAAGDDPVDRLVAVVDAALRPADDGGFRTAVLEIEAQAPYEPAYRDRLADVHDFLEARLVEAIADGVERGRFDEDVDPEVAAALVASAITGAHTRTVATGRPVAGTRAAILGYVDELASAVDRGDPTGPEAPGDPDAGGSG